MRSWIRIRLVVAAAVFGLAALWAPAPASAADSLTITGGVRLSPGMSSFEVLRIAPNLAKLRINIPAPVRDWVTSVIARNPLGNQSACTKIFDTPDVSGWECDGFPSSMIESLGIQYDVPQLDPADRNRYPTSYLLSIAELGTTAKGTSPVTVQPLSDMALTGPFIGPYGAGTAIAVNLLNRGPSDEAGARLTYTFSGAYTTFDFPSDTCTAAGATVSCDLPRMPNLAQRSVYLGLGPGTGTISVTVRVTGAWPDPDHSNDAGQSGRWNPNGPAVGPVPTASTAPGATPARVPAAGPPPVPGPAPSLGPGTGTVPAQVTGADPTDPPTDPPHAARPVWASPFAHYLAFGFLCASSVYLLVLGAVAVRRWIRGPDLTR